MKTVGLVATLTLALLLTPCAADAQPPAKVARIGWLGSTATAEDVHFRDVFQQELRAFGWVEGHNLRMEYRWSEGQDERLPDLVAELVRLQVDVIVPVRVHALVVKHATPTIPIVFVGPTDPIGMGLVDSLARPGGNITGVASINLGLSAKRFELLKEAVPGLTRMAVLHRAANPFSASPLAATLREVQGAAQALGVTVQLLAVHDHTELDKVFVAMTSEGAQALLVLADPLCFDHHTRIMELAAQRRLPGVFWRREFAADGGLMAYGPNLMKLSRRAAYYVDRILKGAKPADLPVEQPMRFELAINRKTAGALGLTFPPTLLLLADEVIQCAQRVETCAASSGGEAGAA